MAKKIILYFVFVLLFVIEKPIFMLYHYSIYSTFPLAEWLNVIWYGLPHDLTCAGYVMALPFVFSIVNVWLRGAWHDVFMRWYIRLILIPVLFVFFLDLELYTHWGFRLDSTVLVYFFDNPIETIRYSPVWALILFPLLIVFIWWLLQKALLWIFYPSKEYDRDMYPPFLSVVIRQTFMAIVLCGVLFIAIRGGVTTSTMNVGRVYFSEEMYLNHAATNPLFSFFSSLGKKDLSKQYRFMSDEEAEEAMLDMLREGSAADSISLALSEVPLLKTSRPNILLVILESICGSTCTSINQSADTTITPNISRFYKEGIGFTNFYANSFRTDRGIASILASYPAQPTYSVMKDQLKCNNLQYMSKRLGENGYDLQYIYGGDIEFTNQKGFLRAGNIINIVCDNDFPLSDRMSKWGVPDHKVFDYVYDLITNEETQKAERPYFKVLQTLSCHEPFDVDYHRFADPYTNSAAYSDSCLGVFIDKLKATSVWDSLLVVVLPDHCYAKYPVSQQNHELSRYKIPMFWTGGAISEPRLITTLGSQIDLSATLFGQMDIEHEDFNFSKDMMNPRLPHFAFYTFSDGFGFVTDSCVYIQDNLHNGKALSDSNDANGKAQRWGKAYLQRLYDDLSSR